MVEFGNAVAMDNFTLMPDRALSRTTKLVLTAAVSVAAVAVTAIAAGGSLGPTSSSSITYSPRGVAAPRTDPGVTPATVVSQIVARVNSGDVAATRLGAPPAGVRETDDPSVPNSAAFANSLWLYVSVKAAARTPEATTKPIWLGNLITGALRDELYGAGQSILRSSLVSVELPDGSQIDAAGGGVGAITPGQIFASASDAETRAQIESAATSAGYTVDSISVVHADQPAPAVVVTTADPKAAAANPDAVLTSLFGVPGTYEGEYLEVRASDGTLVFVQGSAFRTGVGQRWINPAYGENRTPPSPAP